MKLAFLTFAATHAITLASSANTEKGRETRGMMRGFVPKPELDIADQVQQISKRGARKGETIAPTLPPASSSSGSSWSGSLSRDEACVAKGQRAITGDNACANYCSSESFDGHAFADLAGTDTSTESSEECLCFDLSDFTSLSIASITKTSGDLGIELCSSAEVRRRNLPPEITTVPPSILLAASTAIKDFRSKKQAAVESK